MNNKTIYNVCDCRFTVKALGDFIDAHGRVPHARSLDDCKWIGDAIDKARKFTGATQFRIDSGRFAIVNYWKCRRMGKIVPLGGNKVGLNPITSP